MNTPTPLSFDDAIMQCTNTLQSKHNAEHSLSTLLQIIGEYYQAGSSFIFEFDEENQIFYKNYHWCPSETTVLISEFTQMSFSMFDYFSYDCLDSTDGAILTYNTEMFPDLPLTKELSNCNINNIIVHPMVRQDKTTGFVGISNIELDLFDSRLFDCGILFIQECLHKREMNLQLSVLHNLDPLTGLYNKAQYNKKLKGLEQKPPEKLGLIFIQMTGLEKTGEIYGEKYVDVKIKNATIIMRQFFDFPFYRVDEHKFVCFVLNVEEDAFVSAIDQLRRETSSNSDACFTVGHTWSSGTIHIHQEIARINSVLNADDSILSTNLPKKLLSPTECLLKDLYRAIESEEFVVYLQPKVVLATHEVVGAEALVRRVIPKNGMLVQPDTFVPLYEHHAIVHHLDMHVLKKVCEILSDWKEKGISLPISVNFSRLTLMDTGVAPKIAEMCEAYQVPPERVEIEITERLGTSSDDLSNLVVDDFKKLGLNLILDDFGSTYSNFLTLTKVDINEVKIDHSLIENMDSNVKNQKILKSIIDMCKAIGTTKSLAEGVETDKQKDLLLDLNCTYGQGFFFSHPLPADEFYNKFLKDK